MMDSLFTLPCASARIVAQNEPRCISDAEIDALAREIEIEIAERRAFIESLPEYEDRNAGATVPMQQLMDGVKLEQ
jgi:hypothetical protein